MNERFRPLSRNKKEMIEITPALKEIIKQKVASTPDKNTIEVYRGIRAVRADSDEAAHNRKMIKNKSVTLYGEARVNGKDFLIVSPEKENE